jgi:hypothetical protein
MINIDVLIPLLGLTVTWILEMIAFCTSHMIDHRFLKNLHEGILLRCTTPHVHASTSFYCLWWTHDTFNSDPSD